MLNHTKKIKEIYEDIQRKIFYMIPEKWDKMSLYSSIKETEEGLKGELFFYYIPRGIFRKNPVNVYEIPAKFNLVESQYLKLVENLFNKIKELYQEFKKSETGRMWSNITMTIHNLQFKVEYSYEDLDREEFNSYERHIIWRYLNLGIGPEQLNKEEREILKRYINGAKTLPRKEKYEIGIYIRDIKNIVDFDTETYEATNSAEETEIYKKKKNQILLSEEEINSNK